MVNKTRIGLAVLIVSIAWVIWYLTMLGTLLGAAAALALTIIAVLEGH